MSTLGTLTATGRADVHDGEGGAPRGVGRWLDVAASPPPGGAGGVLQVGGEDAAAAAGAGGLLRGTEADGRAEVVDLRPASSREGFPS